MSVDMPADAVTSIMLPIVGVIVAMFVIGGILYGCGCVVIDSLKRRLDRRW